MPPLSRSLSLDAPESPTSRSNNNNGKGTTWKRRFSLLSSLVVATQAEEDPPTGTGTGTSRNAAPAADDDSTAETPFDESQQGDSFTSFNHLSFNSSLGSLAASETDTDTSSGAFNVDDALSAQHRLETSVLGMFLFLETNGIDPKTMEELVQMENRLEYTTLLKRVETYTEDMLKVVHCGGRGGCHHHNSSLEVLSLFETAWSSLQDYAQDRYQQIQQAYRQYQLQQLWMEQVSRANDDYLEEEGSQTRWQDRRSMLRRQSKRKLLLPDKNSCTTDEEATSLKEELAKAVRFKMECQKQVILTKEWIRCMQRRVIKATNSIDV